MNESINPKRNKYGATMNKSRNVDGMVVVSSDPLSTECTIATGTFSGLSCKTSYEYNDCAGPGESFGTYPAMKHYETCYVSRNGYCWSRSHIFHICYSPTNCKFFYQRCDPKGYRDGDDGYNKYGFWHVTAPPSDGSCGDPCREFEGPY